MIFHRLGLINKDQRGFSLTELMLAFLIAGIITAGITITIFSVVSGNIRTSNHMTAVRQAQNAGYWVSHDAQMAQPQKVVASGALPFTLKWTDWAGDDHEVVYTFVDMSGSGLKNLQRSYTINGGTAETSIIAQFIDPDPAMTGCDFTDGKLTFRVTATVGAGSRYEQSETRIYEIVPRPE